MTVEEHNRRSLDDMSEPHGRGDRIAAVEERLASLDKAVSDIFGSLLMGPRGRAYPSLAGWLWEVLGGLRLCALSAA
jgi:hypothetical protein